MSSYDWYHLRPLLRRVSICSWPINTHHATLYHYTTAYGCILHIIYYRDEIYNNLRVHTAVG